MSMGSRGPYRIPPTSALIAFDSAARHGNFSRAAKELRTSQSAISRHIASLERQLSTRLFERSRTGVSLTDAGNRYRDAVSMGLGAIHAGAAEVAELSTGRTGRSGDRLLGGGLAPLMMPRFAALEETLGERVRIRILTYHYSIRHLPHEPVADVILTWNAENVASEDRAIVYREAVRPICSPGYAATHAETLDGPVTGWNGLTFLDLTRPNEGWVSWETWFALAGHPTAELRTVGFDSFSYVLEAASSREGHRHGLATFHRTTCRSRVAGHARRRICSDRQLLLRRADREGAAKASRAQVPRLLRAFDIAPG